MMCTNVCCCRLLWTLRTTTDMCNEIPRFPNQSAWVSLNFCGRNFMAQSCVISTELSSRLSRLYLAARIGADVTSSFQWLALPVGSNTANHRPCLPNF